MTVLLREKFSCNQKEKQSIETIQSVSSSKTVDVLLPNVVLTSLNTMEDETTPTPLKKRSETLKKKFALDQNMSVSVVPRMKVENNSEETVVSLR